MIKDSPGYGHGINSFRTHYMDYQAHHFEQHPDSKYSMLADNVLCPFNGGFWILGVLYIIDIHLFSSFLLL